MLLECVKVTTFQQTSQAAPGEVLCGRCLHCAVCDRLATGPGLAPGWSLSYMPDDGQYYFAATHGSAVNADVTAISAIRPSSKGRSSARSLRCPTRILANVGVNSPEILRSDIPEGSPEGYKPTQLEAGPLKA